MLTVQQRHSLHRLFVHEIALQVLQCALFAQVAAVDALDGRFLLVDDMLDLQRCRCHFR